MAKPIPPLYAHQVHDVQFCLDNDRVLDTSDPGCGKTRVQIESMSIRIKKGGGKVLVIAPKTLLRSAWENDIQKFAPHLRTSVATALKREAAFAAPADVYITNIDATNWLAKKPPRFFKEFDTLIVDECFPAGTKVNTPQGYVDIEMLKPGDIIDTSSGPRPITFTMTKFSCDLVEIELDDGTTFQCTATHPIATDQGWKNARDVLQMRVVRLAVHNLAHERAAVLRSKLFPQSNVAEQESRRTFSNSCSFIESIAGEAFMELRDTLCGSRKTKNKQLAQKKCTSTKTTRGERSHCPLRSNGTGDVAETMGMEPPHKNKTGARFWLSNMLQSRFRRHTTADCPRDRRQFTRIAKTLRCEERYFSGLSRVARVSPIQQLHSVPVYNFQVDGPNDYSVANTLVHNCTAFKHPTSQRSKALAKIKKYFKIRTGLSGTPTSNTIVNLWHQIFILDDGKRLGTSFYYFRGSVCQPKQVGPDANMVKWEDKDGAEEAVAGLLKDMTIRNVFEECHDIPPNLMYTVPYYMPPAQERAYKQLEKNAIAVVNGNEIVSAVNAAVVYTKILQLASGAVYGDNEDGSYSLVNTERYELVADLVEQRTHPCVVFFNWKHQKDELIKEFTKRGITFTLIDGTVSDNDRNIAVKHFQAGFYRVFLAHPQSAAHGITLTRGMTTIWPSPVYNLEHFIQGNRRIYRAGQTAKTETIVVLAEGTIEQTVYEKLTAKNARQETMLSLLKELTR